MEHVGCGVSSHDDDCLCDVRITSVTPIGVTDVMRDMWMGEQLCEYRGYPSEDGWTSESVLSYLTELTRLHDAWVENGCAFECTTIPVGGSPMGRDAKALKIVRTMVRNRLAEPDCPPIAEVLAEFQFTAEHFTSAVSSHKWTLGAEDLSEFDRLLRDPNHKPTFSWLATRFNMTPEAVYRLATYWDYKSPKGNRNKSSLERERFRGLLASDAKIAGIIQVMRDEFNINYTECAVRKARARLKKEGV